MGSMKLDALYILLSLATVNAIPIYSVNWKHGLPYNISLGLVLILLATLMSMAYYIGRAIYLVGFQLKERTPNIKNLISTSYEWVGPYVRVILVMALLQLLLFMWAALGSGLLLGITAIVLVVIALLGDVVVLPCILYKAINLGYCGRAAEYLKAVILIGAPGIIINFTADLTYTSLLDAAYYYPYIWPLSDDAVRMFSEGHEPWFPSIPSIIATIIYARVIALIRDIK
ncbi:MAG: hypothetical protein GSR85_01410 [Desulfurococcales archaeon]|nr:hypothetical protein [Desulfurococcales archaeon]